MLKYNLTKLLVIQGGPGWPNNNGTQKYSQKKHQIFTYPFTLYNSAPTVMWIFKDLKLKKKVKKCDLLNSVFTLRNNR